MMDDMDSGRTDRGDDLTEIQRECVCMCEVYAIVRGSSYICNYLERSGHESHGRSRTVRMD